MKFVLPFTPRMRSPCAVATIVLAPVLAPGSRTTSVAASASARVAFAGVAVAAPASTPVAISRAPARAGMIPRIASPSVGWLGATLSPGVGVVFEICHQLRDPAGYVVADLADALDRLA